MGEETSLSCDIPPGKQQNGAHSDVTNIGVHILERHGNEHRESGYVDAEHKELKDMTSKFTNLSSVSKSSYGSNCSVDEMLKLHKGYIKLKQRKKKCTVTKALYIH